MITGSVCKDFIIKSDQIKNTTISGYASVYDVVDSQNDIISKGAFGEVLAENIRFLWQHDRNKPIGIIKKIYEDQIGLRIEAEINNNIICGREASELLIQKALDGLSVGFDLQESIYGDGGSRIITKAKLMEVSIVTFPANNSAAISDVKAFDHLSKLNNLVLQLIDMRMKIVKY